MNGMLELRENKSPPPQQPTNPKDRLPHAAHTVWDDILDTQNPRLQFEESFVVTSVSSKSPFPIPFTYLLPVLAHDTLKHHLEI